MRDFDNVLDYTKSRWGKRQAQTYADAIKKRVSELGVYPMLGITHDPLSGLRRLVCGSHVCFYCIRDTEIEIIRLLHQQMDPRRYLH